LFGVLNSQLNLLRREDTMKLYNRYLITCMAATAAWALVCVVALALWLGISTHAHAQPSSNLHEQLSRTSQNIAQNSRGPAAFPSRSLPNAVGAERTASQSTTQNTTQCSDYQRQVEQLQLVIQLQNQKIALLAKK
jgi:ABC-type enterobactin transport system permease subunit